MFNTKAKLIISSLLAASAVAALSFSQAANACIGYCTGGW